MILLSGRIDAGGGVYDTSPTGATGRVVLMDGTPSCSLLTTITDPTDPVHVEHADVAPNDGLIHAGKMFVSSEQTHKIYIRNADGSAAAEHAFDTQGPEQVIFLPECIENWETSGGFFFSSTYSGPAGVVREIRGYPASQFTNHAGAAIVPMEVGQGVKLLTRTVGALGEETVEAAFGDHEYGDFVPCPTGNVTRTPGYWQTHKVQLETYWPSNTDRLACTGFDVDSSAKALGGLWGSIPKNSDGSLRNNALDSARMKLAFQLIPAILNNQAFGSTPDSFGTSLAAAETAFCGTDISAINTAKDNLGAFNESGDDLDFPDGFVNSAADPKAAKAAADIPFWNSPIPASLPVI
jgi:hypothetical protein